MKNFGSQSAALRRPLLWLTIATLPFAYIPHEILRGGPSFAMFSLGLILLSGLRYGAFRQRAGVVDAAALLLAGWIAIRLLVFGPLELEPQLPAVGQALTDIAPIIGGIVLFRLGRIRDLRQCILSGLMWAVVIMLAFEAYQLVVGLGRLMSLGYTTPLFNYYTESGAFRPFSTFLSPTVFGGYLAMVGAVVCLLAPGRWKVVLPIGVVVGLALTYTRASWIAFSAAACATVAHLPARTRGLLVAAAVPLLLVITLVSVAFPDPLASLVARFDTVTDASFSSNSIRVDLWGGVLTAIGESPVVGYGAQPFSAVMQPYVGTFATLAHAHNNYLQQMFLYGVPGLVLLLSLIMAFGFSMRNSGEEMDRMWTIAGRAALAVFLVDSFFEATWGSFNVAVTLFLLVGLGSKAMITVRVDSDRTDSGKTDQAPPASRVDVRSSSLGER